MYIARILYPVKVLGPGNRIGIWMCGCKHGCKGCSNPELWDFQEQYNIEFKVLQNLIENISRNNSVDGFTITGGEPFLQPEALAEMLPFLRSISTDLLIYSGYSYAYLKKHYNDLLEQITILIDGKYIESRNTNAFLRGSDNQEIHILDPKYKDFYTDYINNNTNKIQNFRASTGFISVGIHNASYREELAEHLAAKGILIN